MKRINVLLIVTAIIILAASKSFALIVGFNEDIHNGTGQDAYDFHLEGILKSSSLPTQVSSFIYPVSFIPGFDWQYQGGQITSLGGDYYKYSGGWAGIVPVPHCSSIHVGKYFDEECHNILMDLVGWWTDEHGEKITSYESDVPLVGFEVDDLNQPQILRLFNDTGLNTNINGLQVAVTNQFIPIESLMEHNPILDSLGWIDLPGQLSGQMEEFNLTQAGVIIPPSSFLVARGYVFDQTDQEYHFFADIHQSHVPIPSTLLLLGSGFLGLLGLGGIKRKVWKS